MAGAEGRSNPYLKLGIWISVWLLTRFLIVSQVGYWDHFPGIDPGDVDTYEAWSNFIAANHAMPPEETWQYPPGAAFLFLIPRIGLGSFVTSFVGLMLIFDLVGLGLLISLAKRERRDLGVWVWLLAMPLLFTLPVLRFDMAPTVIAMAALVVIHRRPGWFGALAGLGAMVKVWPAFLLFAEWDHKRSLRAAGAALAVVVAIFAIAWIAFGNQTGFITNQGDRGLQIEAVAATPWHLREVVRGTPPPVVQRYGTNEIGSSLGDTVGKLLDLAAVAVLLMAAAWWLLRDRAIKRGHSDLEHPALSRDFAFTIVLLFLVVSRVLSPQFMVWMVGLSAIVLCSARTRLARPAWIVVGAVVLTAGLYQSPANFVIRNTALLVAAVDAAIAMGLAVYRPGSVREQDQAGNRDRDRFALSGNR
ncbi:MAG: glycosyltransferase family 87 protein [Solirubrobacterales bacterium]